MLLTTIACTLALLPVQYDVVHLLLEVERPSDDVATELAELRPFPVHEIFWMLEGDAIPADWSPLLDVDEPLTRKQRWVLASTLVRAPRGLTMPFLNELLQSEPQLGVQTKMTIVEVVGWIGRVEDLPTLLRAGAPESELYLAPRPLRKAFGDALGDIFARAPKRIEAELPWVFQNAHSGLRKEVLTLAESGFLTEPIETLGQMLGLHPEFDLLVLHSLHAVGATRSFDASDHTLAEVRRFFDGSHPSERRMACRVVGVLNDVDAISILIRALESPNGNLRQAAAYGLEQCTGLNLDQNVLRWRSWYERDSMWWENDANRCFDELANGDPHSAMKSLMDITGRSLDRRALALSVLPALDRPEVGIVVTTCAFLGRQGSSIVCADLVPLLDSSEISVRVAALKALRRITGLQLAGDARVWGRLVRVLQW